MPQIQTFYRAKVSRNDIVQESISKYKPGDNFDEKPEYELLYNELTGVIQDIIEDAQRSSIHARQPKS